MSSARCLFAAYRARCADVSLPLTGGFEPLLTDLVDLHGLESDLDCDLAGIVGPASGAEARPAGSAAVLVSGVPTKKRMGGCPGDLDLSPVALALCPRPRLLDNDGHDRLLFTGTPERIAEDLRAYKAMGVQETIFDFRPPPLSQTVENMEHFMKKVAPLVE